MSVNFLKILFVLKVFDSLVKNYRAVGPGWCSFNIFSVPEFG